MVSAFTEKDAKIIQFIYFVAIVFWVWLIITWGSLSYTWVDFILYYPVIIFLINIYGIVDVTNTVLNDTTVNPAVASIYFLIFGVVSYLGVVRPNERSKAHFGEAVAGISMALLSEFNFYVGDSAIPYVRVFKLIFNTIGLTLVVHSFSSFMIEVSN